MRTKILMLIIFSSFNLAFSQKKPKKKTAEKPAVEYTVQVARPIVIDESKVYTEVEQLPEFPGGLNVFRTKFGNAFDSSKISGGNGNIKCKIKFVIDASGKVSDVSADGSSAIFNREAVRAIKTITTLWSPARINNKAVKYNFILPVEMQF